MLTRFLVHVVAHSNDAGWDVAGFRLVVFIEAATHSGTSMY